MYDLQDQLANATHELGDHLDRLKAFSRSNKVRFFNAHAGPGEDYKSNARKVHSRHGGLRTSSGHIGSC